MQVLAFSSSTCKSPFLFPSLQLSMNLRIQAYNFTKPILEGGYMFYSWDTLPVLLKHFTSPSSGDTNGLTGLMFKLGLLRKSGPCNQRSDHTARDPSYAGFSVLSTWNQFSGLDPSCILCTPLATKVLILTDSFLIYPSTTVLSVQKYSVYWIGSSFCNLVASCTLKTAAINSRRGMLKTDLKGTTLHFPIKKLTPMAPCS